MLHRSQKRDRPLVRRPSAWKEFAPLDIACAAAVGVHPSEARPGLLAVESAFRSVVSGSAPCPLAIIDTFRGVAVRVFEPLRPAVEELVQAGMAAGDALSRENRRRIVDVVAERLPIVEVWHDLLHFTDREHFAPVHEYRVRRVVEPVEGEAPEHEKETADLPYHEAYGVYVKDSLVAYADVAARGDYACSLGVFTEDEYRGRGMAKSAVSAATRAVLSAGRIPLYAADESNLAALSVCRSLGYLKFGRDLYCFMASDEERSRLEAAQRDEELRAADFALRRWILD